MNETVIAGAIGVIALNVYVTVQLLLKAEFNRYQKVAQSIIIWIVPVFGALLIMTFIKDDETPKGPRNPNDGQGVDGMPGGVQ
jgi:NADH:ubiquinone oxidoreductase subunit 6 (subunit J)